MYLRQGKFSGCSQTLTLLEVTLGWFVFRMGTAVLGLFWEGLVYLLAFCQTRVMVKAKVFI